MKRLFLFCTLATSIQESGLRFTHIPYKETHAFSQVVIDYLENKETIQPLFQFGFDIKDIKAAIEKRPSFPVDRNLLYAVLKQQYASLSLSEKLNSNLELLQKENTFTICTAHQPNLLTGYLYFVYKIVHAITLSEELNKQFPEQNFVPVYYMGSEDNDLNELGVFHFNNQTFRWNANGQKGAVGRMKTESLQTILDDLFTILGPPGKHCEELKELLTTAYLQHETIASATQFLVNEIFGKYGLIVLNPDDAQLKSAFKEIMNDDLLKHTAFNTNNNVTTNYKEQAFTRPVNLFYLNENLRERIERKEDTWRVNNTSIQWTETELLSELEQHPERFSPNVILRGLFQETILPNIAFIGGGSEVAYWLQLKPLFEQHKVFFPSIHLRQSVLIINSTTQKKAAQLQLTIPELFLPEKLLETLLLERHAIVQDKLDLERKELSLLLNKLKEKAVAIDVTLNSSVDAVLTKMQYQISVLEKKMLRAEKRKISEQFTRLKKLKEELYPSGILQERRTNFIPWFLQYGDGFIELLIAHFQPLLHEFLVIEED